MNDELKNVKQYISHTLGCTIHKDIEVHVCVHQYSCSVLISYEHIVLVTYTKTDMPNKSLGYSSNVNSLFEHMLTSTVFKPQSVYGI